MVPQNCVSHFLQNIFLCVQQNKDIHTGLELFEGEQMTEFSFLGELSHLSRWGIFVAIAKNTLYGSKLLYMT